VTQTDYEDIARMLLNFYAHQNLWRALLYSGELSARALHSLTDDEIESAYLGAVIASGEGELCSPEPIAGGAEPSEGSED
jgi:hypothetical protein